MAFERINPMAFQIEGDTVEIEQDDAAGQVSRLTLHRMHIDHIAAAMQIQPALDLTELYQKHLARLNFEFEVLMDCYVESGDPDMDVPRELHSMLLVMQSLIESMCDAIPTEKRRKGPNKPIYGASPKHSKQRAEQLELLSCELRAREGSEKVVAGKKAEVSA